MIKQGDIVVFSTLESFGIGYIVECGEFEFGLGINTLLLEIILICDGSVIGWSRELIISPKMNYESRYTNKYRFINIKNVLKLEI